MNKKLDFERWEPQPLSEEILRKTLARREAQRQRRKKIVILYIAFLLYVLTGFAAVWELSAYSAFAAAVVAGSLAVCVVCIVLLAVRRISRWTLERGGRFDEF